MTQSIPVEIRRRTLAGQIRYIAERACLAIPDEVARLGVSLALEDAAQRADTDAREREIYYGQAADRERALALVQCVREELARLTRLLPDPHGPGAQYAEGARWVLDQITQALGEH